MVDREDELADLTSVLDRVQNGGQLVLLGAPSGTGKSTLVGAVVRRAEQAGFLCLARRLLRERQRRRAPSVQDALADYLVAQPPEWLRQELGQGAVDLAYVVPELRYHLDLTDVPPTARSNG